MIRLVILSVLFRATFSTCPAMRNAYQQGSRNAAAVQRTCGGLKRVGVEDIGNIFFAQPPYSEGASNDFNRTIACILSEQIFVSGINDPSGKTIRDTLKLHSMCLPVNQRCSTMPIESCPKDSRYRSVTGACNNVRNPKWGKSITGYGRILPPSYSDGIYEIRKSHNTKEDLPPARRITNRAITKNPFTCDPQFTANHGAVMFGQLMAHDHGMRQMIQAQDGGMMRSCCNADYSAALKPPPFGCHAFEYTHDDPFLAEISPNCNIKCMNFLRSQMIFPNDCHLGPAEAVNMTSHYLDLSPVYGYEESTSQSLRSFQNGLLKMNKNRVLPETCNDPTRECYLTGDLRGTAFFTLGILQSAYHRFHNYVAEQLKKINPKWTDERLYQEARRIVIAVYQNHVIDWLRVFVGDKETRKFRPVRNEYVGSYDRTVDASSTAEFSHCVFRVYHSNLADQFFLVDDDGNVIKTMEIDECDDGLKILETHYDDVMRGMVHTPSAHTSYSAKIRNQMFNNGNKYNLGLDLISTDLFIGRDLGIQPYYVYFEQCTNETVTSWADLHTIPAESIADLKKVYKTVFDVDTYAALALEEKCGSYLGTVGKYLMVLQYERTIAGDRYFYSLPNGAYPFTPKQLEKIYKFSYANFLCTVTNISRIQTRAFEIVDSTNPVVKCSRGMDLSAWKDTKL